MWTPLLIASRRRLSVQQYASPSMARPRSLQPRLPSSRIQRYALLSMRAHTHTHIHIHIHARESIEISGVFLHALNASITRPNGAAALPQCPSASIRSDNFTFPFALSSQQPQPQQQQQQQPKGNELIVMDYTDFERNAPSPPDPQPLFTSPVFSPPPSPASIV